MTQSPWICSLPWTGFSNDPDGKVRPCCLYRSYITQENGEPYYVQTNTVKEIFASKFMQDLRQEFRDGKKPKGCEVCIKDELNQYRSKRQTYLDSEIGKNVNYDLEPELPVEYQMILSNACNLKCRSCSPSHSNLWQAEWKQLTGDTHYPMPHGQSGDKESVLWKDRHEWMQFVKRLEIVGGEPFYIKQWQDLWKELIEQDLSKDILVDMSSNGIIYAGEIIDYLCNHFKWIGVGLSIDGIGKTYEYLRHPGKWESVSQNIIKYHDYYKNSKRLSMTFSHTIGWVNAWELPEFHTWVHTNTPNFRIWNNIIHRPRHMSLIMLPKQAKDIISNKWDSYNWKNYKVDIDGIKNFMYSENPTDEEIRNEYKSFIQHDKIRNENIIEIIPKELQFLEKYF